MNDIAKIVIWLVGCTAKSGNNECGRNWNLNSPDFTGA
jgi:hypothetical protein